MGCFKEIRSNSSKGKGRHTVSSDPPRVTGKREEGSVLWTEKSTGEPLDLISDVKDGTSIDTSTLIQDRYLIL